VGKNSQKISRVKIDSASRSSYNPNVRTLSF
jgi:hypothetical protein